MSRKGKSKTKGIAIRVLIGLPILTLLLALGAAKLILGGSIGEERMGACACAIAAVVAFSASLYVAACMPQKKIVWGMMTAATYGIFLLLGNLLFFGVAYGSVLPVLSCVLGAGLLGSFLAAIRRRKYA